MAQTIGRRVEDASSTVGRRLANLIREMAPPVLFFFIALMLIFAIFKLFVEQYSIEFSAFSKAAIGALILGKVVLLLDWAESRRKSGARPLAMVVALKTLVYAAVVIVLGTGERIYHSSRETGSLTAGARYVVANVNMHRFLGLVLLISMVMCAYLVMEEISHAMGKGALMKLFFTRPVANQP